MRAYLLLPICAAKVIELPAVVEPVPARAASTS